MLEFGHSLRGKGRWESPFSALGKTNFAFITALIRGIGVDIESCSRHFAGDRLGRVVAG